MLSFSKRKFCPLIRYLVCLAFGFVFGCLFISSQSDIFSGTSSNNDANSPAWRFSLDEPFASAHKALNASKQLAAPLPRVTRHDPLIFIGGYPRSGTTLMRVLLDIHSQIRCGPETRVIPRILSQYDKWTSSKRESNRLRAAGILGEPIDSATIAFILEIIRHNGPPATRLCNKDPLSFARLQLLSKLFPNARFILMIRDGRAVANSIVQRKISIFKVDNDDPWSALRAWQSGTRNMWRQCLQLTLSRCLIVKYEKLVLFPRQTLQIIMNFLGLKLEPALLEHERHLSEARVKISKTERSSDQVINSLSKLSLFKWALSNHTVLTKEFIRTAHERTPLIKELGYDTSKIPPDYSNVYF